MDGGIQACSLGDGGVALRAKYAEAQPWWHGRLNPARANNKPISRYTNRVGGGLRRSTDKPINRQGPVWTQKQIPRGTVKPSRVRHSCYHVNLFSICWKRTLRKPSVKQKVPHRVSKITSTKLANASKVLSALSQNIQGYLHVQDNSQEWINWQNSIHHQKQRNICT